jgi:hypothetical protein
MRWVRGVKRGHGVTLTTHPHLVPRSRMSGSYTISWRLHGVAAQLYLLFFPPKVGWVRPSRGCLLTLAYYTFPRWYEFGERRWNDILTGENRRTRRKTCPSATLSTTNPTWNDPGANPNLRGKSPATNDLSHGTAIYLLCCYQVITSRQCDLLYFSISALSLIVFNR